MSLEELRKVASEVGISPESYEAKQDLVYAVLDQQAQTLAETQSEKRKPGRPRKEADDEQPKGKKSSQEATQTPSPETSTPDLFTTPTEEGTTEAPKRKRGRPSKAEQLARQKEAERQQALTAVAKASESQAEDLPQEAAPAESTPTPAPKAPQAAPSAPRTSPAETRAVGAPTKGAEPLPRVVPIGAPAPEVAPTASKEAAPQAEPQSAQPQSEGG